MVHLKGIVLLVISLAVGICTNGWCHCEGDLDCNGVVDGKDLASFSTSYGDSGCATCATVDLVDYRPPIGSTKVFERTNYSQTPPVPSEFTGTFNGNEVTKTFEDGGWSIEYFPQDLSKLASVVYYDASENEEWETILNPPIPTVYFSGVVRNGESWGGGSVKVATREDPLPSDVKSGVRLLFCTFVGLEDVTVPAGTFESCARIHLTIQDGQWSEQRFYWLAQGIGLIKLLTTDGVIEELKRIEP